MPQNRLHFIFGASGTGKHALTRLVRDRLDDDPQPLFAHRYITGPPRPVGDNHIYLTDSEFDYRVQRGCFAMHWFDHGCQIGIGVEINQWLGKGLDVVVVGSPACLTQAGARYPELHPILIRSTADNRRRRLLQRGTEDAQTLDRRLRHSVAEVEVRHPTIEIIDNNGLLDSAAESLRRLLLADRLPSRTHGGGALPD
jgi:ribose 1,5-bisphosphokinase